MDKLATAESRGSAPGRQFQAFIDVLQQRAASRKAAEQAGASRRENDGQVKAAEGEESWKRSLFVSPKKKLQARWEQVSPSVRQTLHRYSPRKLRGLFAEEDCPPEHGSEMDTCSTTPQGGSEMLSERQTRYKQIAAFYLDEGVSSSQGQLYLNVSEGVESATNSPGKEEQVTSPQDQEKTGTEVPYTAENAQNEESETEIFFNPIRQEDDDSTYKSEIELDLNYTLPLNLDEEKNRKSSSYAESDLWVDLQSVCSEENKQGKVGILVHSGESKKSTNSVRWFEGDGSEISSERQQAGSICSNEDFGDVTMPVGAPHIILQGPDTPVGCHPQRPTSLHPPPSDPDGVMKRKSPVTVQEWVDHLPVKPSVPNLKAEEPMENASMLRCHSASRLSREASVQSSSSLDSLLDSRKPDPVEVLLNLGFGGVPGIDLDNCRIPKRFLVPSKCKGGDWDEFIRRELIQVQNFECSSLGFRGLSGPSHQRPSAIVANIMEKLREQVRPRQPQKNRFTAVARRVLSETSVLSRLSQPLAQSPSPSSTTASVLTPDNRKFLESQGKISPEVPRRRVIFGQKSFAIDKDGELVEEEPRPVKPSPASGPSEVGSWSACSAVSVESDSEDGKSELFPSQAELLRMRRSSLQRQRNVEEVEDEDGPAVPLRFLTVPEDSENLRGTLAAEIETLSRKVQSAPPEELAAILESIKDLRVKLNDL